MKRGQRHINLSSSSPIPDFECHIVFSVFRYVGHSKSNAICSVFFVFLSDRGNVFNFLKFDSICIKENKHQLNRTIHFIP